MIYTYDPSKIIVTVCGYRITGIEDVDVKWNTKQFRTIRGIRGLNTRCKSSDSGATVSIRLMQTAIANDVFSSIVNQDLVLGTARLDLTIEDTNGQTLIESTNAFISGWPSVKFNKEIDSRDWEFTMLDCNLPIVGSSFTPTKDLF